MLIGSPGATDRINVVCIRITFGVPVKVAHITAGSIGVEVGNNFIFSVGDTIGAAVRIG